MKDHIRFSSYGIKGKLYNAIRKYGKSSFKWDIIYISDDKEDTLLVMEQVFIDIYDSISSGYNQKEGGKGGSQKGRVVPPRSEEYCRKVSERQIGRKLSKETRKKISKAHMGKVVKEESTLKRIKSLHKDRYLKDPNGVVYHFLSIKDFCEEHNLGRPEVSKLLRGKLNQHKGWTNGLS
jgi:hypothetical protein